MLALLLLLAWLGTARALLDGLHSPGASHERRAMSAATELDSDGDGLSDEDELRFGTDPHKADTDGDGLNDWEEINVYRTDPLRADSDGDGLNDFDELFKYSTNPLLTDSDNDGVEDGAAAKSDGTGQHSS